MIYTVTLNPALDKTVEIPEFALDRVNRIVSVRTDPGGKGINVSKVIQKLGSRSIAVGILGGTTGKAISTALDTMGIESDFSFAEGETRINLKCWVKVRDDWRNSENAIKQVGLRYEE